MCGWVERARGETAGSRTAKAEPAGEWEGPLHCPAVLEKAGVDQGSRQGLKRRSMKELPAHSQGEILGET